MNIATLLLIYLLIIISCTPADAPANVNALQDTATYQPAAFSEGLQLLKTYCYACHNPAFASHDEILAPPMAAVKNRYHMLYPTRSVFIDSMTAFLKHPRKETAIMYGAVQKFGVMVKVPIDDARIRELVIFIHDNPLEEPSWFGEHYKSRRGRPQW